MKKENIEFLKNLQKELNTQDTVGQASPRFWVVRTKELIWEQKAEYSDDIVGYVDDGEINELRDMNDILNLEEDIEDYLIYNESKDNSRVLEIKNNIELLKNSAEEKENTLILDESILREIFSDMYLLTKDNYWDDDNIYYGHYEYETVPNTMFLTLREAQEHCNRYHYRYNEGHPYAMTAWRSPQVEKLLKILETEDFDNLREV